MAWNSITAARASLLVLDHTVDLVEEINADDTITPAHFDMITERAFIAALPVFLDGVARVNPALAAQMRARLLADEDLRLRVASAYCVGCGAEAGELCDLFCYDAAAEA